METYILVGMLGTNFTRDSLCPLLRVPGQTFCALLQRFPAAMEHRIRSATPREFGIIRILRFLPCNRQVSVRLKIHCSWSFGESSERPSWDLFDMTTLCLLFGTKKWLRETVGKS